ncbi:uncharacterized protein DUF4157 [Kordia periserrulae]|uniref:Uncharacterized protein DUF4157 n=1 Tax=Kordia periserrulae TaxID=701523 RepID=A0A2T6C1D4_9FLAO|nr:DUF4157 domain-containing protein [Kordia periserrulae]PTX62126.1 uncharacterized protein DUF4157 [Kordia periserrulae]
MFAQSLQGNKQTGKANKNASPTTSFIPKKNAKSISAPTFIQPKLKVGQPNDSYEKEADTIATKVVTMSKPPENLESTANTISTIHNTKPQRKILADSITPIIQKSSNTSENNSPSGSISQKLNSKNGKGDHMDATTKNYMESRFSASFQNVRIHKDHDAVQMSQSLGARAFTNGNNIYFNKGQYAPNSQSGKHLLAHELTHTIQQKGANSIQRTIIQKQDAESDELQRLREILGYFDIPENEVIAIFGSLNAAESNIALNDNTLKVQAASALDNNEMFTAMRYNDGAIKKRLEWMFYEGTSWEDVQTMLTENTQDVATIRSSTTMRGYFAGICDNDTMVEAVEALGGDLNFQLNWMAFEGASTENVYQKIRTAPDGELTTTLADTDTLAQLESDFSESTYNRIVQMLNGLLVWEEIDTDATERHFEDDDGDGTWEEKEYAWDVNYDIEYHRDRLKIIVRIELDGETVPAATKSSWLAGIRSRWNGHFHIQGPRRLAIEFDPVFTDDDNHISVEVHSGSGRANRSNWYLSSSTNTIAHEFGHIIGLEDEYRLSTAEYTRLIGSSPTAAGSTATTHAASSSFTASDSVMGVNTQRVHRRHLSSFVSWLNSNRLPGESVYRLMNGP